MTPPHTPATRAAAALSTHAPAAKAQALTVWARAGHGAQRLSLLAVAAVLAACASNPLPVVTPGGLPTTSSATPEVPAAAGQTDTPMAAAAGAPATPSAPAADAMGTSAPVALDPLNPTVRVDLNSRTADADLWGRVRQGYAMPDLNNDLVRKWEQWYGARPDYVQRMTDRGGRYMFHIVEELNRRNMPTELALLPFIESAYNPQAMSTAKASGMWQFIPGTGRDFALKQNMFRDDRRDVLASTRAAMDYLQSLHKMFGDWHLALAAYNWGQGNVQRAINRNRAEGLATDYEALRMPDETRNYVPKLQAVKNIVLRPQGFNLALTPLKNHPYFISVGIDRDIDLDRAAKLAGLPMDEFKALNPQMNKPVILAAGTPQVLLPYDNANQFVRAVQQHRGPLASWTAWVAPKTLKPSQAAAQLGMDESTLRELNKIPPRMLIKAGSTLLVSRAGHRQSDVDERVADNAQLALAPDLPPFKRVSFRTGKRGTTVAAVAKRYGVTPAQVAAWNPAASNGRFGAGQTVTVLVRQRGAADTDVAVAGTAGARATKVAYRGGAAAAKAGAKQLADNSLTSRSSRKEAKVVASASPKKGSVGAGKLVKPGPTARSKKAPGH